MAAAVLPELMTTDQLVALPVSPDCTIRVPFLAVEILCPTDTRGEIHEKIRELLSAGVKLVWIVDPTYRTVTVYRADAEPELFNANQSFSGEPHLPGFNVAVADVFSR